MECVVVLCLVMRVIMRYVRVRAVHNKMHVTNDNNELLTNYDNIILLSYKMEKLIIIFAFVSVIIILIQFGAVIIQYKNLMDSLGNISNVIREIHNK